MGRPKQPVNLLLLKGKKHLTKEEIEKRKAEEIQAPTDNVEPPTYLTKKLKKEFNEIANELRRIDLISNLDVDALARFLLAREQYIKLSKALRVMSPTVEKTDENGNKIITSNEHYGYMLINVDRMFKQCRAAASDLGLTVTSRCKLVVPKKQDEKPKSEEEQMFGDAL